MCDQIPEVYFKINKYILDNYTQYNTPETRDIIYKMLKKELKKVSSIRCDEKNNTHSIIKHNMVIARVKYYKNYDEEETYFIDLIFGDLDVEFV